LGDWKEFKPGDFLTKEGQTLPSLYFVVRGEYDVERKGHLIASSGAGTFVGEMAYISDSVASASVVVKDDLRAFVFDAVRLKKMEIKDGETASALHQMLGKDMVMKLRQKKE
jgi:CRP-like cAMP-binding protein